MQWEHSAFGIQNQNQHILQKKEEMSQFIFLNLYFFFLHSGVPFKKTLMCLKHLNVLPNYGNVFDVV